MMATSPKIQEPGAGEPKATFPANFTMTARGLVFHLDDDMRQITGPFEVIAQTRDRFSQAWGVLLRWRDDDDELHQLAIAMQRCLQNDLRHLVQSIRRRPRSNQVDERAIYSAPITTDQ